MWKLFTRYSLQIYLLGVILLFFYSFTQIDLGLALTRFPQLYAVQQAFQYIGYFNRPLSTWLFVGILGFLFVVYFFLLSQVRKKKIDRKTVWKYIFIITAILAFSYNAFSYDLFNYIFDAKIFTYYQQNPYEHKALDFPQDPMLGFMHWTHRTYPYGPVWLALSIPLSYAGMQVFVITFFLFKLFLAASFLGAVYFIEKIAGKTGIKNTLLPVVLFAFNPYIIIECLVSAHNDTTMLFFALAGIYALLINRYIVSLLLIVLSVATKYATLFLLPVYLVILVLQYMKIKQPWSVIWLSMVATMMLAVLAASQTSGNFQPWYLLYIFPFLAFFAENRFLSYLTGVVSINILGSYIPYLYLGNWDEPVPSILSMLYTSTLIIVVVALAGYAFFIRRMRKKYV